LPIERLDRLLIENVGNLVCPAECDVGEDGRAMVFAITEGEDKPLKYPVMFRAVDIVAVNKIDLLPHLDFDMGLLLANLRAVNPGDSHRRVRGRVVPLGGRMTDVPAPTALDARGVAVRHRCGRAPRATTASIASRRHRPRSNASRRSAGGGR
jgi:hypothetical protein